MGGEEVKRAPPASAAQSGQVVDWPTRGVGGGGGGRALRKGPCVRVKFGNVLVMMMQLQGNSIGKIKGNIIILTNPLVSDMHRA